MKIESLFKLLPENISEASKSGVVEFIKEGLEEAQRKWEERVTQKDTELAQAKQEIEALKSQSKVSSEALSEITEKLQKLESEAKAKELSDKYQSRMESLSSEFDLSDEEKKVVAKKAKTLDDAAYEDWFSEFSLFAESKKKEVVEASKVAKAAEIEELKEKIAQLETAKASAPATVVAPEAAAEEVEIDLNEVTLDDNQSIATSQTTEESEPTLAERLKKFRESIVIKL